LSNVLLLRTSTLVSQPTAFPRIGVNFIGGGQNYSQNPSALIAYLSHFDVPVIGGDYEGAAAGDGYNRNSLVNAINLGDGLISPLVLQYNTCDRIGANGYTGQGAPNSLATPLWYNQFLPMAAPWSVWASGSSGTHVSSGYAPTQANCWLTNPCDLGSGSKDANGNALYGAFSKYVHDYYFAGSTADSAPNLAGFYCDNFSIIPYANPTGDYLQSGSPGPANTANTIYPALIAGTSEAITSWRNYAPSKLFVGNDGGWAEYLTDNGSLRIFQRSGYGLIGVLATTVQMDFQQFEAFMGPSYAMEAFAGLATCAQYMAYNAGMVKRPTFNLNTNEGLSATGECTGSTSSVGAGLRYWLAASWILDNGLATYFATTYVSGNYYESLDWADWWSVNPATGACLSYSGSTTAQIGANRRWLGLPMDPVQSAPTTLFSFTGGPNLFARRFITSNGREALVLANESTNYHTGNTAAVCTLPSGGGWQKLLGSGTNYASNTSIENGATGLTTVTIPTGDGLILLR
jgi:hypothetical protein